MIFFSWYVAVYDLRTRSNQLQNKVSLLLFAYVLVKVCRPSPITVVVQSLSPVRLFATPWTAACQAFQSFTISWSLLKLMSMELVMPPNHFILCRPLLLLLSVFPSIGVFSVELALWIRWTKYWSFSFSISHFKGYSGLISFRIDWFDLAAKYT